MLKIIVKRFYMHEIFKVKAKKDRMQIPLLEWESSWKEGRAKVEVAGGKGSLKSIYRMTMTMVMITEDHMKTVWIIRLS